MVLQLQTQRSTVATRVSSGAANGTSAISMIAGIGRVRAQSGKIVAQRKVAFVGVRQF